MRLLLLITLILSANASSAQSHPYVPLSLDTSCFWKSEFAFQDGGYFCGGERISAVTKDTFIGGMQFFEVTTYTTRFPNPPVFFCNVGYLSGQPVIRIREDTATRKIYYSDGGVALDLDLKVGDTLLSDPGVVSWVVDSINIQQIQGINRRVQWASPTEKFSGFHYQTIEGIGMNYNFPMHGFSEWGAPVYRLQCYSKGGQTLYSKDGSGTCVRKLPVGIERSPDFTRQAFSVEGNNIRILDGRLLPVNMQVFDMNGKLLQLKAINSSTPQHLDLSPGNYLFRLFNDKGRGAFVVPILQ